MSNIEHAGPERIQDGFSPQASDLHSGNEHPSINFPFNVVIDGRSYEGVSLSMAAAKITGLVAPGLTQGTRLAMFRFDFGTFLFSLPIAVIIDKANADTGEIDLTYAEPAGPHMPQLRYLLNAWLAGDVINLHDILQAKSRLPRMGGNQQSHAPSRRLAARFMGVAISVVASALLVFGASWLIAARLYQHDVEGPSMAVWTGPLLRATTSGQLSFFAQNPSNAQPLYTIESASGASVTTVLPCDCAVREQYATQGATVLAGEPIAQLNSPDGGLVVEALLTPSDLNALSDTATIVMTAADGTVHRVNLNNVKTKNAGADPSSAMLATIKPGAALAPSNANKPVRVTIDTTPAPIAAITDAGTEAFSFLKNWKP
ncbi:hypothetical protein [uncultured Agrobacterium sp.]|uniref:hypothetical protein n=1 Tax=uncultured Agrobacterium sp. TaxID=157277 RepID=UPI0025EC02C8|nr:hypothetical protein [uncultured Agrobacterium sp.]